MSNVSLVDGHMDKMTNYERIKSMSIDEMVELISKGECYCCKQTTDQFCVEMTCEQGIKQWLESEVETE